MEADLNPTDPDVQALVPKIRRGDMDQMSFGFTTKSDIWRQEGERQIRELHNVDLFDVSAVTYPAYQATEMALRSLAKAKALLGMPFDLAQRKIQLARLKTY
jgi:HK97 family phage prohead protease